MSNIGVTLVRVNDGVHGVHGNSILCKTRAVSAGPRIMGGGGGLKRDLRCDPREMRNFRGEPRPFRKRAKIRKEGWRATPTPPPPWSQMIFTYISL